LIGDGVIDRDGVPGLAKRLGYSERQLHRTLVAEVGAGPLALARSQRAQTARILLETTDLPVTEVAFAAGFASVRQFNDTVQAVFAMTPSALRSRRQKGATGEPGTITLRLPYREPMTLSRTIDFFAARAIPGVEVRDEGGFSRTLRAPGGPALVTVSDWQHGGALTCKVRLADQRDLVNVVARVRRLFDLDADPVAVDALLGADPSLAPLVAARPGLRSPGAADGVEMTARAIVGQQISVAGARTVLGRVTATHGDLAFPGESWLLFPSAEKLAEIDPATLPMPRARGASLARVAARLADGSLDLDPGADRGEIPGQLLGLSGIGPWTADYLRMRAVGEPDVLLGTDLGVRDAARRLSLDLTDGRPSWAPWRSYATHHLWATLPSTPKEKYCDTP
jgi:AraC family transcriptional regulator of adaptative response / DNA-3-methyladenine glycosylase II